MRGWAGIFVTSLGATMADIADVLSPRMLEVLDALVEKGIYLDREDALRAILRPVLDAIKAKMDAAGGGVQGSDPGDVTIRMVVPGSGRG